MPVLHAHNKAVQSLVCYIRYIQICLDKVPIFFLFYCLFVLLSMQKRQKKKFSSFNSISFPRHKMFCKISCFCCFMEMEKNIKHEAKSIYLRSWFTVSHLKTNSFFLIKPKKKKKNIFMLKQVMQIIAKRLWLLLHMTISFLSISSVVEKTTQFQLIIHSSACPSVSNCASPKAITVSTSINRPV